jgi:hypothetical protein
MSIAGTGTDDLPSVSRVSSISSGDGTRATSSSGSRSLYSAPLVNPKEQAARAAFDHVRDTWLSQPNNNNDTTIASNGHAVAPLRSTTSSSTNTGSNGMSAATTTTGGVGSSGSDDDSNNMNSGAAGSLLSGMYDERANRRAFEEARREWLHGATKSNGNNASTSTTSSSTSTAPTTIKSNGGTIIVPMPSTGPNRAVSGTIQVLTTGERVLMPRIQPDVRPGAFSDSNYDNNPRPIPSSSSSSGTSTNIGGGSLLDGDYDETAAAAEFQAARQAWLASQGLLAPSSVVAAPLFSHEVKAARDAANKAVNEGVWNLSGGGGNNDTFAMASMLSDDSSRPSTSSVTISNGSNRGQGNGYNGSGNGKQSCYQCYRLYYSDRGYHDNAQPNRSFCSESCAHIAASTTRVSCMNRDCYALTLRRDAIAVANEPGKFLCQRCAIDPNWKAKEIEALQRPLITTSSNSSSTASTTTTSSLAAASPTGSASATLTRSGPTSAGDSTSGGTNNVSYTPYIPSSAVPSPIVTFPDDD